jgi:hypothetical protein
MVGCVFGIHGTLGLMSSIKKERKRQELVAHTCNPSYLEG